MPTVSQRTGGRALLRGINYGFVVALVVVVFWASPSPVADGPRHNRCRRRALDDFRLATEAAASNQGKLDAIARLGELQDSDAFRAAVVAIVKESKRPMRRAASTTRSTAAARRYRRSRDGPRGSARPAPPGARQREPGGRRGGAASRRNRHVSDTGAWSWILLGRLYQRGDLAAAERAFAEALGKRPRGWAVLSSRRQSVM